MDILSNGEEVEIVGTCDGDSTAHVKLPFSTQTICGLPIDMVAGMDDNGYTRYTSPRPATYSGDCASCMQAVDRLENFMLGLE